MPRLPAPAQAGVFRCEQPVAMIYALLVTASPTSSRSGLSALRFARAVLARGHRLPLVFFLDEGTLTGGQSATTPSDETDLLAGWVALGGNTERVLCVSSALRRGLGASCWAACRVTTSTAFTLTPRPWHVTGWTVLPSRTWPGWLIARSSRRCSSLTLTFWGSDHDGAAYPELPPRTCPQ